MKRDIFQSIADPTRRAILTLLAAHAMTPNAIAEHFSTSRQAISKHLNILAESGLVKQKPSGREVHYSFNATRMKAVDEWLEPFRALWDKRFTQLDDVLLQLKNKKS